MDDVEKAYNNFKWRKRLLKVEGIESHAPERKRLDLWITFILGFIIGVLVMGMLVPELMKLI
ncbi:MAG: hypothetical protein ACOCSL_03550 [Thermoplasmatota archaeon]